MDVELDVVCCVCDNNVGFLMKYYYFRDYCDLSMDVELDVVCCVCDNNVGLFDEVLLFQGLL